MSKDAIKVNDLHTTEDTDIEYVCVDKDFTGNDRYGRYLTIIFKNDRCFEERFAPDDKNYPCLLAIFRLAEEVNRLRAQIASEVDGVREMGKLL